MGRAKRFELSEERESACYGEGKCIGGMVTMTISFNASTYSQFIPPPSLLQFVSGPGRFGGVIVVVRFLSLCLKL